MFPYIINVLNIFGLTIYNINAYLIPLLMKYQISKEKKMVWRYFYIICFSIMLIMSISGTILHFIMPDQDD